MKHLDVTCGFEEFTSKTADGTTLVTWIVNPISVFVDDSRGIHTARYRALPW